MCTVNFRLFVQPHTSLIIRNFIFVIPPSLCIIPVKHIAPKSTKYATIFQYNDEIERTGGQDAGHARRHRTHLAGKGSLTCGVAFP